jgi:NADPH:quinone reductase-like Zn-dependent oxidoreductase
MKAILCRRYGGPDVLRLEDVAVPVPRDDEVLVRVQAASLNAADVDQLTGSPLFIRLGGWRGPGSPIPGSDIAGVVERAGRAVTRFRPGDAVFAELTESGFGALAEFVCAPEQAVALRPAGLSLSDAAAIPQAGTLALQAVRDEGYLQPGLRVLVNGAGGGVGTFAVQMARHFGTEVTGVDSAAKLETVRALGASATLDYRRDDFTRLGQTYDLIVETVGRRSMADYRRALTETGRLVVIGGSWRTILGTAMAGEPRPGEQHLGLLYGRPNPDDLSTVAEMVVAGHVRPVIGARFPLAESPQAYRLLMSGEAIGKVLITVGPDA